MSDQAPTDGAIPVPAPDPFAPPGWDQLAPQIIAAIQHCAATNLMATSSAEMNDAGNAALKWAQTFITLDPARLQGGDTPEGRKQATPERPPVTDRDHDGKVGG